MSWQLYDWLIERASHAERVRRMLIGLQWSVAELSSSELGLCFSPRDVPRTLSWPGTLAGRDARELHGWLRSFDPTEACVGLATLNASLNGRGNPCLQRSQPVNADAAPHLRVFAHFAPKLRGAKVVVVGRYPGLSVLWQDLDYVCLERSPAPDTLGDPAAEYLLPEADWVFLTASAIANKTLPRLLELSRSARVVLMGPSLPWLADWADFGVDYLAGVRVRAADALWQTAAEGGGTRIFDTAVEYRVLRVS